MLPVQTKVPSQLRRDMPTRAAYSSDASIFRRVPAAVLEPHTVEDIREAIAYAREKGWPIVGRGGGSSVAGNAIGDGLIIDTSRHFNRILNIDPVAATAEVEPGVVCDQLRAAAAEYGLTYGPDPSTHSRCTIGGMVANNACGSHSVAYGTAAENLAEITLMLADGREVTVTQDGCSDPVIDAQLRSLFSDHAELIQAELGRFPRQVSGYGLHYLAADMAKAIAGSEGTLGIITKLKVKLVAKPQATALAVLAFDTVFEAARHAAALRLEGVATIEGMGGDLLDALRSKNGQEHAGENLPGQPGAGGWLYCEVGAETEAAARRRAEEVAASVPTRAFVVVTDPKAMRELWRIREASAGTVTRLPDGGEAWPNWEDSAVPPENLAEYLRDLYALMDRHQLKGIPFGHFGEGCVHVRISFDFQTDEGIKVFSAFMREAAELVTSYGGSLSGEHGDGRARSELLATMYSPEMRALFEQFKLIFDPERIFNPGVLVWADPVDQGLRMDPGQRNLDITQAHAFSHDGGDFLRAVNRCVGVSACRSMEGAMCPSFQITGDEVHSTRGRSRILSELFRGETVTGDDAAQALDLCLSCKACSSECPVNVDMATYKSEFLNHHYKGKLRPMAHYVMGWLPLTGFIAHKVFGLPTLIDTIMTRFPKAVAALGGLDSSRPLIRFAHTGLRRWARTRTPQGGGEKIVLWPDSFNSSLATGPATAAVEALEALGFEVIIPQEFVCCGLTWHSTGQLGMVNRVLEHTAKVMKPYLDQGLNVVAIEPSCTTMLRGEAAELNPNIAPLAAATKSFAEVVAPKIRQLVDTGAIPAQRIEAAGNVLTQVHCHERSAGGGAEASAILDALGFSEAQIETGCCGLAGNWGFEKGHGEMSMQLGERELFPRVRAMDKDNGGTVLADGFSCRTQIAQGTGVSAKHLAEIVAEVLKR